MGPRLGKILAQGALSFAQSTPILVDGIDLAGRANQVSQRQRKRPRASAQIGPYAAWGLNPGAQQVNVVVMIHYKRDDIRSLEIQCDQ
jgi:hypothetical protein